MSYDHGRKSWGGRGGRVPPTFWSGGDTYINCPPHFLSGLDSSIVVLKYCFNKLLASSDEVGVEKLMDHIIFLHFA